LPVVRPDPSAEIPSISADTGSGGGTGWPPGAGGSGLFDRWPAGLLRAITDALAALLADMVELTRSSAVYPGHLALIAERARAYESVQRALRGER